LKRYRNKAEIAKFVPSMVEVEKIKDEVKCFEILQLIEKPHIDKKKLYVGEIAIITFIVKNISDRSWKEQY